MLPEQVLHLCAVIQTCRITSVLQLSILTVLYKAKQNKQELTRNELALTINRPRTTTLTAITQLHRESLILVTESDPDTLELSDRGLEICQAAGLC